jgi:hypothetical protein
MSETTKRPIYVTILMILTALNGVVAIGLGIFVIADRNDAGFLKHINENDTLEQHQLTPNLLLILGIGGIAIGCVLIGLSFFLGRGSKVAQFALGLACVGNAAFGLHSLVAMHGEQQMSGTMTLALSVFTLWLLFGHEESKTYFVH